MMRRDQLQTKVKPGDATFDSLLLLRSHVPGKRHAYDREHLAIIDYSICLINIVSCFSISLT